MGLTGDRVQARQPRLGKLFLSDPHLRPQHHYNELKKDRSQGTCPGPLTTYGTRAHPRPVCTYMLYPTVTPQGAYPFEQVRVISAHLLHPLPRLTAKSSRFWIAMRSRLPRFRDPLNLPSPPNPQHLHLHPHRRINRRSTYRGDLSIDQPLLSIRKMRMVLCCWMSMTKSHQYLTHRNRLRPQRRPDLLRLASLLVSLQNRSQSHLRGSLQ